MDMTKLARRIAKAALLIALFCLFARFIDTSRFISLDSANSFAEWLHGNANQENFDDLWFFSDVALSLLCAIVTYSILTRLARKMLAFRKESVVSGNK